MSLKKSSAFQTLYLAYASLGAIYGDIGTSPLYVLSSIFTSVPNEEDLLGGLSCIFWIFTVIVIIKYCFFVLQFGPNHNEGGQIAIYSKIASKLKLSRDNTTIVRDEMYGTGADEGDLLALTRTATTDTHGSIFANDTVKGIISAISLTCAILGCSLVFSDGLLTPTTSVLSAVAGISIAEESFTKVMPVSVVILLVLFLAQRFGSGKLSLLFSPIVLLWSITLLIDGIYWVAHKPMVFKALNPALAFKLLARQKDIDILSPVMLCITGTEAMFADVGHFGANPIRISMVCFLYPSLIIAYLGQGAFVLLHPEQFSSNLFYSSIPFGGVGSGYYWFVFILAILATIIASQALILSCFSILKQLITLDCFPRLKIVYTSKTHKGRVYIPVANYVLMVAVIFTTVGFKNSNAVTAAYGLGISIDFLLTTILISITLHYVYHYHWIFSVFFFLVFASLEACLVISGIRKFVHGAWFPIMICIICFTFINCWRYCRGLSIDDDARNRKSVMDIFGDKAQEIEKKRAAVLDLSTKTGAIESDYDEDDTEGVDVTAVGPVPTRSVKSSAYQKSAAVIVDDDDDDDDDDEAGDDELSDEEVTINYKGSMIKVPRIPKVFVVYCSSYSTVGNSQALPHLTDAIISSFLAVPEVCIFIETRVSTTPTISEEDLKATIVPIDTGDFDVNFYRCIIRSGFTKQTKIDEELSKNIIEQVVSQTGDEDVVTLPILNVFERDMIVSRDVKELMGNRRIVDYLKWPALQLRYLFVDWIYSPIASFGSMEYLLAPDNKNEFIYVGSKVRL